eukprot:gene34693-44869_t
MTEVHRPKEDELRELPPPSSASVLFESAISVQYSSNTSVVNDPAGHSPDTEFAPRFLVNGVQAVRRLREGGYGNLVVGVTGNVLEHDVA